jgi:DNA polymerase III delta subunit
MIIFLYGPGDYSRTQKKQEIIAEFEKKHSTLGVGEFDLALPGSLGDLTEFLRSQSIFEIKKLAIVDGLFPKRKGSGNNEDGEQEVKSEEMKKEDKGIIKLLQEYLEAKNITILISESKKPTKQFGFLLKKPTTTQEFEELTGVRWELFIKNEAKKQNMTIGASALRFLAEVYQGNSWGLATELQKIGTLKRSVDLTDLDELGLTAAPNYWGLLNGVKGYDIRARLTALETLFATGDPAPKLFNMLASQWKEKIPQFAKYDLAIKSGKLEYEEALVDAVIG